MVISASSRSLGFLPFHPIRVWGLVPSRLMLSQGDWDPVDLKFEPRQQVCGECGLDLGNVRGWYHNGGSEIDTRVFVFSYVSVCLFLWPLAFTFMSAHVWDVGVSILSLLVLRLGHAWWRCPMSPHP